MLIEYVYTYIWVWSSFLFCLMIFLKYGNSTRSTLLDNKRMFATMTIVYCVIFTFWIGFRPMDIGFWGDSVVYRRVYNAVRDGVSLLPVQGEDEATPIIDTQSEWLWKFINDSLAYANAPVEWFFFIVECGYIGFMYLGIRRLIPYNQWITLLFCISSFSFFSFSYNGLRNGLACSMIIYALSYFIKFNKKGLIIGLIISFLAMGIHRSVALPALCALVAYFTKLDFKWAYSFWLLSIVLSLIAGPQIQSFFAGLGFDDRMQTYAATAVSERADLQGYFSHTGFRWDFLLYSAMPIILGYYIVYKKKIRDHAYEFLIVTYTLANSFWVMVIQAVNSNRFAYLSWFMYPIVFAYPLLKVKIWKDQDRKTAQILMLYVLFTLFMNIIYM